MTSPSRAIHHALVAAAVLAGGLSPLLASASHAGAVTSSDMTTRHDQAGDVEASEGASQAQRDTVDIKRVRYQVTGRRLVITTKVVDLTNTPGRQIVETEVGTGGDTFSLSSELGKEGKNPVMVFTGSAFYKCKGSSTVAALDKDRVVQSIPKKCLDVEMVKLTSGSSLVKNNGRSFAVDLVRQAQVSLT